MNNKRISNITKVKIFRAATGHVMMYAAETLSLTREREERLRIKNYWGDPEVKEDGRGRISNERSNFLRDRRHFKERRYS